MNYICLTIWIAQFVYGIVCAINKIPIYPALFLCAVAICIASYIKEIIEG